MCQIEFILFSCVSIVNTTNLVHLSWPSPARFLQTLHLVEKLNKFPLHKNSLGNFSYLLQFPQCEPLNLSSSPRIQLRLLLLIREDFSSSFHFGHRRRRHYRRCNSKTWTWTWFLFSRLQIARPIPTRLRSALTLVKFISMIFVRFYFVCLGIWWVFFSRIQIHWKFQQLFFWRK